MKRVIDMCPWQGLSYEEEGVVHYKGEGLTTKENERLDEYFNRFSGGPFLRHNSIVLAQLAIDNRPIPDNFYPMATEAPMPDAHAGSAETGNSKDATE